MIAIDLATAGGFQISSYSHTVGTTRKRILWVITAVDASTTSDVSGVTYGGVALTQLAAAAFTLGAYSVRVWYLVEPASGAANVVLTGPSLPAGVWTSSAISYSGADSVVPDAVSTASGAGTPYAKSLTTVAMNSWMLFVTLNTGGAAAASTGSTLRVATNTGGFNRYLDLFDSGAPLSPGSNSMTVTEGSGPSWASALISFAPAKPPSMLMVF